MVSSIWIPLGNGGNGVERPAKGMLLGHKFVAELYECFDTNTHYLSHLTKLKQSGIVEDFISTFERYGSGSTRFLKKPGSGYDKETTSTNNINIFL
jgi:hypothetical protein